jgi:hypothetical protein
LLAKLGDATLAFDSYGGWIPGVRPTCAVPRLRTVIAPPLSGARRLALGDASRVLDADLGDAMELRSAALVGAPAAGYRQADTIEVRWSHAQDLVDQAPLVWIARPGSAQAERIADARLRVTGDRLRISLAGVARPAGTAELQLLERGAASTCGGACSVRTSHALALPLELID